MADRDQDQPTLDPVTRLAHELFENPKTRPLIEEGIATLHPDRAPMAVPGYVMRQEFQKEREEFRKEVDAFKTERAQEKEAAASQALGQQWHANLKKFGARDDEIKPMFELAVQRKIGDPEAVVDQYRKQQTLAAPTSGRFGVQIPGEKAGEFFKGLTVEGADDWARNGAARDIEIIKRHGVDALERLAPSPLR